MTAMLDETHDPERTSWVKSANGQADFPIQNLPLGIFSIGGAPRGGIAIGDHILDLSLLAGSGLLKGAASAAAKAAAGPSLNALLALGAGPRRALRRAVSMLLSEKANEDAVAMMLVPAVACRMQRPVQIGDYTDFYVGIHQATNVGSDPVRLLVIDQVEQGAKNTILKQ